MARELSVGQESLYRWVRDERRRLEAASTSGEGPLTPAEHGELMRLRHERAELRKDNAFLGKVAAYACHERDQRLVG